MRKRRIPTLADDESEDKIAVALPETSFKRRRTTGGASSSDGLLTPTTPASTRGQPTPGQGRGSDFELSPVSAVADADADDSGESETSEHNELPPKPTYREVSGVALSGPAYPRSAYQGWSPPAEPVLEAQAISKLKTAFDRKYADVQEDDCPGYTFFHLDNFSIYRTNNTAYHEGELVSLHLLQQDRYPEFVFDGTLSVDDQSFYVQGVPFRILSVDGYGELDHTDLGNQMCIQSRIGKKQDIWYQLGRPAAEYRQFYQPFLWLARFAKHFVDFLLDHDKVSLGHFRYLFLAWLKWQYGNEPTFCAWLTRAGMKDFRTTIAAHVGYLRKECCGIDPARLLRHPLWAEVNFQHLAAIPQQPNREHKTVVTPYAHECFESMYFADQLVQRKATPEVMKHIRKRKQRLRLTPRHVLQHQSAAINSLLTPMSMARDSPEALLDLSAGDVVCVHPDLTTKWGADGSPWFVYVQQVRVHGDRTLLDVLWLYEPKDTTMGKAYYPFKNELFMSDNCSCGREALDLECAIEKLDVSWFARDPYAEEGLFVRQKFRTIHQEDTYDFVALEESDFSCKCEDRVPIFEECRSKYAIGDTVLVRESSNDRGEDRLQPAQIVHFDTGKRRIQLRRMRRRSEIEPESLNVRPNELVLSSEVYDRSCDKIIRKCHVRFFGSQRDVVAPYDRDGLGDFYYIASDEPRATITDTLPLPDENGDLLYEADDALLPRINQGWDPQAKPQKAKLKGMGIFCGGGTFDRGLEEGGGVDFRYAVDWAEHALHSHRANVPNPDRVKYFLGSVNDCLANAMKGNRHVARPGQVQFISAGSPCPGFSQLQTSKLSDDSRRNASMVASVVAYVDFYVPEYFVLENVVTMTSGMGKGKNENVFSQIIAALVGLGYQVQQFLMDAWSYGSSQQRSRVFIVASAPGLPPFKQPQHSHGHPNYPVRRALGKSSNGLSFGIRKNCFTAFKHVSPRHATADLPVIADAQPQICLAFPDHRTANSEPAIIRTRMAVVPTRPHGMGLMQAKLKGLLRGEPSRHCDEVKHLRRMPNSKMYARVYPDFLFPTIITRMAVGDGIGGRWVHWEEPRTLTVMEARRAQGYLDHEVLVGTPVQQLKIVGNSVDRKVALMLGLLLRESWMGADTGAGSEAASDDDELALAEVDDHPDGQDIKDDGCAEVDDADVDLDEEMEGAIVGPSDIRGDVAMENDVEEDITIDNRSAKIALQLTAEEIEEVKRDHFRAIRRILDVRA